MLPTRWWKEWSLGSWFRFSCFKILGFTHLVSSEAIALLFCVSVSNPPWCKFCSWEAKSWFGNILFLFLQISSMFSLKEETVFYASFFLLNIANSCPEFTVIVVIMPSTHWSLPQPWAFSSTLARLNDFFLSIVDGGCSFVFQSQLHEIMTQKLY